MELTPGLHRIEAPLGDRYVAMYLVVGADAALLVDTGIGDSVTGTLLPYLDGHGLDPGLIRYVVNTHCDFDHVGGNRALRQAIPHALWLCGEEDRPLVSDIERMITDRYGEFRADHGFDETEESKAHIRQVAPAVPVAFGLRGGEVIDLGDRPLEILHTPGHSRGHLSIYDSASGSLLIGDAVLGESVLTATGEPAFPPTYRHVDAYRATIRRLRAPAFRRLLTAHYPIYEDDAATDFLDRSLNYTDQVEEVVMGHLSGADRPTTLLDLVAATRSDLGTWDEQAACQLVYPIAGHLEALTARGLVVTSRDTATGYVVYAPSR